MSKQNNLFINRLSLLAIAACTFFASCKKEAVTEPINADAEINARNIQPASPLCKATSFKLTSTLPHTALISITEDSLYDIQYDLSGKPKSAKGKDWINRVYNHTFEYDANNNLTYVKQFSGAVVNKYQKLTYPAGSKNSMSNKITVTTYLRNINGILREVGKTDYYFNSTGKLTSVHHLTSASNTIYYHIYNAAGNLQYESLGSTNGTKTFTFGNYDNQPNVYSQHRVWQLLSGNFSTNNPLTASSTWHDVPAQQLRKIDYSYQYQKNAFAQVDRVVVTHKFHLGNGAFYTDVYPVDQIWKNSCDN